MRKDFEDRFMDIQAGLISLCLEVTDEQVDKVFAYASIEEKSLAFNAFFEKEGQILTLDRLDIDDDLAWEFLKEGTMDLQQVQDLCRENGIKTPTEMKMYYDVKTGKYKADYSYEASDWDGNSEDPFMIWYHEVKEMVEGG